MHTWICFSFGTNLINMWTLREDWQTHTDHCWQCLVTQATAGTGGLKGNIMISSKVLRQLGRKPIFQTSVQMDFPFSSKVLFPIPPYLPSPRHRSSGENLKQFWTLFLCYPFYKEIMSCLPQMSLPITSHYTRNWVKKNDEQEKRCRYERKYNYELMFLILVKPFHWRCWY